MGASLLPLAWLLAAALVDNLGGEISGTAVNGTAGESPLPGAAVVLRVSQDGAFVPIAETVTDEQGRFCFGELPVDQSRIYLPGVNRLGIHYPGPRVRLAPGQDTAQVKLIAFDTVQSPSPLISRRHEIAVETGKGLLEVTETLLVDNPSRATFIGIQEDDRSPATLRLALPRGIEKVTFDREFHGRNFQLQEGKLVTDLPWPPGSREIKFIYRLPVEQRYAILERLLDHPTEHVVVRVKAEESDSVACNLANKPMPPGEEPIFEHRGKALPAGYAIRLEVGDVPLRFESYARWLALAVLIALAAGSILVAGRSRRIQPRVPPPRAVTNRANRRARAQRCAP